MAEVIQARRQATRQRLQEIQREVSKSAELAKGKACVYLTGSYARLEANRHSDLDLFIVGLEERDGDRSLRRLDEIRLKADLIDAARKLGIPEFSGDGQYLVHYTVNELVKTLGTPQDDASNTFTARLLLLLESRWLVEGDVYKKAIDDVIASYWRDYEKHKSDFVPAFLANDILRLWRTFCVNYEARTSDDSEIKRAKRKIKNYKLRHSRLLTCYSALLYLLATYNAQNSVSPDDAYAMISLTPTERLEWLADREATARAEISQLLEGYEAFLEATNEEESVLIERYMRDRRRYFANDSESGDLMFQILQKIGGPPSKLFRLVVV